MASNSNWMLLLVICILFQKAVCSRHSSPILRADSMGDTVALLGQDVDFSCKVDNLGRHMVAFVRAGFPPRLISFDEKVFRQRDKYELKAKIGPMNNEWILTIKNVQEKDRGNYSCQINTDPVLTTTGELDVRVPPSVSRSTPSAVEIREGHNVTLTCKAEGNPTPSVIWRRKDRQIIRYNGATGFGASVFHGSGLHLTKVNRKHMSEYICVASNGIPPDESWAVKLLVTFAPLMQAKTDVVKAHLGGMARIVCTAESWPRPDVRWEKDGNEIFDSDQYATTHTVSGQYHSVHILEIRRVEPHHFGNYRCVARNDNGIHYAQIHLEEAGPSYLYTNAVQEGSGLVSDDEDSDRDLFAPEKSERSKELDRRKENTNYHSLAQPQSTTVTEPPYAELKQHESASSSLLGYLSVLLATVVSLLRR